jgi:1,4-dihydroxy-2-naphthoate polyprenyltransferase
MKLNVWISAFRLRTLPLSLASIGMGAALAAYDLSFSLTIFIAAIATTLFLQILSNLANDYGDHTHGADDERRIGPTRAMQTGLITAKEMRIAIGVFVILSLLSGCSLLYFSFKEESISVWPVFFFVLGLAAIAAAINYTAGKNPYGYKGWGDVFVFVFFGLVAVGGTYFLMTKEWSWDVLLPAFTMGLFAAAVLNVNNIRDIESDRLAEKKTLAMRLGPDGARLYHVLLILIGIGCSLLFVGLKDLTYNLLLFPGILPALWNAVSVYKNTDPKRLDPWLKQMVFSSLIFLIFFTLVVSL